MPWRMLVHLHSYIKTTQAFRLWTAKKKEKNQQQQITTGCRIQLLFVVNALKLFCIMYQFQDDTMKRPIAHRSISIASKIPKCKALFAAVCIQFWLKDSKFTECQREINVCTKCLNGAYFVAWNRMKYHSNSSYSFHLFARCIPRFWNCRHGNEHSFVHSFVENRLLCIKSLWTSEAIELTTFVNYRGNYTHVIVD